MNLHNSILYQLELDGIFQVPFLNQEAAFNYYVSEEGDGSGTVFFIEEPSVIYDDASTGDKLAVAPYSANLLEDRIVLDADFNFSNNKNENLNVQHVIAKQMYIKANGEIGWHKTGFFVWTNFVGVTSKYEWRAIEQQQTGNFGGFVYKVNSLGIGYSGNGQYHFATRGNIVLEEHSLSTKNFDVQISYNQNNFRNRINDNHDLVDADRHELDMAYPFEWVDLPKPSGYDLVAFKNSVSRYDSAFATKGWMSVFLANHDQARMVSRFGTDTPQYRALSSKMLTTFILFDARHTVLLQRRRIRHEQYSYGKN